MHDNGSHPRLVQTGLCINPAPCCNIRVSCADKKILIFINKLGNTLSKRGKEMNTKQLIDEAVSLPVEERAMVIDLLLRSLNQPESEIDKKWAIVAKKRLAELRSGVVQAVPGQEVFQKIWNRFEK